MEIGADTSAEIAEDDLLPLSALQHYLYCPRQYALIHVEQLWAENRFTAEGRMLHERTDRGGGETRDGVRVARAVPIRSLRLGVVGVADVVELHDGGRRPVPVEYKRGRPRRIAPTRSSSAPRRSVWRRCSDSRCRRASCSMGERGAARR